MAAVVPWKVSETTRHAHAPQRGDSRLEAIGKAQQAALDQIEAIKGQARSRLDAVAQTIGDPLASLQQQQFTTGVQVVSAQLHTGKSTLQRVV